MSHSSLAQSMSRTSQSSMRPPSFVPKPFVCPSKFVHQRHAAPSSTSYFFIATSSHSGVVDAKMVGIYAAKGEGISREVHQFPSPPIPKAKHIRFTYYDNEDDFVDPAKTSSFEGIIKKLVHQDGPSQYEEL